jgi:hypothetical protein
VAAANIANPSKGAIAILNHLISAIFLTCGKFEIITIASYNAIAFISQTLKIFSNFGRGCRFW